MSSRSRFDIAARNYNNRTRRFFSQCIRRLFRDPRVIPSMLWWSLPYLMQYSI